jgi:hypothetical protein
MSEKTGNKPIVRSFEPIIDSQNPPVSIEELEFESPNSAGLEMGAPKDGLHCSFRLNSSNLSTLSFENRTLKEAVHNLVRMHRLTEDCCALLQEHAVFEDAEKMNQALETTLNQYARESRILPPYDIAREAKIVLDAANIEMDSDELADILNLDAFQVEGAMKKHYLAERP